jgi:putative phosphoesterase
MNAEQLALALHAGDYSAPFVPRHYTLKVRMIGVFGNNDAEREKLRERFAQAGHVIRGRFTEVEADKLKIALTHGDEDDFLKSLTSRGRYDVVVYGHTHEASITQQEDTLVINPGEICGYLTGKSTYAVLDTATRKARLVSF